MPLDNRARTMTDLATIEPALRAIAAEYSGKCTVAVTDLHTGAHIGIEEDDVMPSASLAKVPVLVTLYQGIDEGRVRLEDRIRYEEQHRCLGSGVLSMMQFGVEMTVRDAATLMIVISDNSATNMCLDLIGVDRVNEKMRELTLLNTTLFQRWGEWKPGMDLRRTWVSSAGDTAKLCELIARREAVSAAGCDDMLKIMRRLEGRAELSRLLPWNEMNMLDNPRENWVAEKGGSLVNGVRTSGAVMRTPRGFVSMAAFCEGGTGPGEGRNAEGNVTLGRLGKTVWDAVCA